MISKFHTKFNFQLLSKILPLLYLLLYGCASETSTNNHDVFRYNEFRNITSLDPAFARNPQNIWPIQQLFNGLVQLDDSLNIIPEIAKSWNISADGKKYTFKLREDVYFHESPVFGESMTRTVNAEDFVYSFDRLKDGKTGSLAVGFSKMLRVTRP